MTPPHDRTARFLLLVGLLWASWLAMMLVHEAGHVLAAVATGGRVERVVWHPLTLSRTDVSPNPQPRTEVLAGPTIGGFGPLVLAGLTQAVWRRGAYLVWFFAGFCLIANGAYLGVAALDPVGDAKRLIDLGVNRWLLAVSGTAAAAGGLAVWHAVSPRFGFGRDRREIDRRHAAGVTLLAGLLTALGLIVGQP